MRTGKHQFNYLDYVTPWAVKILAGVSGYSLSKAYAIDYRFGKLIKNLIDTYRQEIEMAKRFSTICGVYQNMRDDYTNFYKGLREDVSFFLDHKNTIVWDEYLDSDYWKSDDEPREILKRKLKEFGILDFGKPNASQEFEALYQMTIEPNLETIAMNRLVTKRIDLLYKKTEALMERKLISTIPSLTSKFVELNLTADLMSYLIQYYNNIVIQKEQLVYANVESFDDEIKYQEMHDKNRHAFDARLANLTKNYVLVLDTIDVMMRRLHLDD